MTEDAAKAVLYEERDSIAIITLNRPESANALTLPMSRELLQAAIRCDEDASIRAIVLTGTGKLFCAGGDLESFAEFGDGLGALRGGAHLFWIGFHSIVVWFVASTIPMLAGFWALGINFGSPLETLVVAWITLAAVGMAVAIPSAPGFFGTYHAACKLALEPFGVSPEIAVALGTLLHGVFWVTLTLLGFAVLRFRRTSFSELGQAAKESESPSPGANVQ